MASVINGDLLQAMVRHWLGTPPNGYLGSGYGADVMSLLQQAMLTMNADAFIAKMREDLPIIGALPSSAVNLYFEDRGNDSKVLLIEVMDSLVSIDNLGQIQ